MIYRRVLAAALVASPFAATPTLAAAPAQLQASAASAQSIEAILRRLDALEQRNQALSMQVEALQQQNQALRAQGSDEAARKREPASLSASAPVQQPQTSADEWASRIKFKGDFRYRHENLDDEAAAEDRSRETVRVRFGAAVKVNDAIDGEIGIASGGRNPRGGSSTLGGGSSRKDIGLDLAYMNWRAFDGGVVSAGKMHQPFIRPGLSAFIDNEIRPEGVSFKYTDPSGVFGSAFRFWLEERAASGDSMLSGGQIGWGGELSAVKVKVGAGYYDYGGVRGRYPGFGDGVVGQYGNTVIGAGGAARYAYDYNIAQLFGEASLPVYGVPLELFFDYARNSEADNHLDTAYNVGFVIGKANQPGRWEAGAYRQKAEKDALFGQWTDSDFAGGVTDNSGQLYRVSWMALKNLLVNATYFDSKYNVDVGDERNFGLWQLEFNVYY